MALCFFLSASGTRLPAELVAHGEDVLRRDVVLDIVHLGAGGQTLLFVSWRSRDSICCSHAGCAAGFTVSMRERGGWCVQAPCYWASSPPTLCRWFIGLKTTTGRGEPASPATLPSLSAPAAAERLGR